MDHPRTRPLRDRATPLQTSDPVPFTFNKPTAKTKCGIVLQGAPAPVVTINSLNANRPAAFLAKAAGLQVGDTVISINGENVKSATHGATLLKAAVGEVKILVRPKQCSCWG